MFGKHQSKTTMARDLLSSSPLSMVKISPDSKKETDLMWGSGAELGECGHQEPVLKRKRELFSQ